MSDILPEVPVSDADSNTRHIYERIMATTGVGSPALIFRHFAIYPGLLDWVWQIVGPPLESGRITGHALQAVQETSVVSLPAVSLSDMHACGVDAAAQQIIDAMLGTYNRMNPVNLSLISAIRDLIDPNAEAKPPSALPAVEPPPPAVTVNLPAPLKLDEMRDDVRKAILELCAAIPSPGTQVIPTLYRHLAIWPDFMMSLAPGLLTAMERGEIEARMADLNAAMQPLIISVTADARAMTPPPPPLDDPQAMVRTLNSFLYTIPQLVIVGTALRAVIPAYGATNGK
ncbi:MAG: hypothetical protein RH946_08955 [Rhodospirillales bacterium]